jgi:competence protein ComEA
MFAKLTYRLLLLVSLFVLSSTQQVFAADKTVNPAVTVEKTVTVVEMSDKININMATNEQLATVKGIGVKKAQAIIDYRQEHGEFVSLNDLMKVKGIGPGTLKKIEPFLTL